MPPPGAELPDSFWPAYVAELSSDDRERFIDFALKGFSELMRHNPDALARLPEDVKAKLQSAVMRRFRSQRQTASGAPKVFRPCPYCNLKFGARELRVHKPHCPKASKL